MLQDLMRLRRHSLLIRTLVVRDLKARYRGSFLGWAWSFLNPLFLMLVYALVFSFYLRAGTENYAAFLCSGLLPWIWFQSALMEGTQSIVSGSNLVSRALFPAEILPLTPVLSNLVHFVFGLPMLAGFLLFFQIQPSPLLVLLPVLMLIQAIWTSALVLFLATLNVFFRDIHHLLANFLTLWFFTTPVVYELEHMQEYQWLQAFNPMYPLIQAYQDIFYYGHFGQFHREAWYGLLGLFGMSLVLFALSYRYFESNKDEFVEQV